MPAGYPFPQELQEQARELYSQHLQIGQIADLLGPSKTTIRRWLFPEEAERQRRFSREHKRRRAGSCAQCGAKIWYTSTLCADCSIQQQRQARHWTQERVIEAIQNWAKLHGRPPAALDWMRRGEDHPAATAIYGHGGVFPRWNDAIAAAGFTPRRTSPGPGNSKWSKSEARKLREQGLTDVQIARLLGVSASAIAQRIGRRYHPVAPGRSREQRIQDLERALHKGEQDGDRDRAGNNHD